VFKLRREHHTAAAPRQEQGQGPQVLNMCERPNWSALLVYYGEPLQAPLLALCPLRYAFVFI